MVRKNGRGGCLFRLNTSIFGTAPHRITASGFGFTPVGAHGILMFSLIGGNNATQRRKLTRNYLPEHQDRG